MPESVLDIKKVIDGSHIEKPLRHIINFEEDLCNTLQCIEILISKVLDKALDY